MEAKIMVVPGRITRVELSAGMSVLAACEQAERQVPGVGWVALAQDREVRVQNLRFSNKVETVEGTFGSIHSTPLNDGNVVLILSKIKGNEPGEAVLTCWIDGVEYALETPDTLANVLANVAGYDLSRVATVLVNGDESPFDQLVGSRDYIMVKIVSPETTDDEEVTVVINWHTVTGRPEDIHRILMTE